MSIILILHAYIELKYNFTRGKTAYTIVCQRDAPLCIYAENVTTQ